MNLAMTKRLLFFVAWGSGMAVLLSCARAAIWLIDMGWADEFFYALAVLLALGATAILACKIVYGGEEK